MSQKNDNDDDLTPSFTGFMGFLKEKALSPIKYLYQAATSSTKKDATARISEPTTDQNSRPTSLSERVFEGDFEFRELFEDPVTNVLLGLTTLFLVSQGLSTPFGSVVVANPGGTAPGRSRHG